jgi:hypothetical protein
VGSTGGRRVSFVRTPVTTKGGKHNNFLLGGKQSNIGISNWEKRKAEGLGCSTLSHLFLGGKGCSRFGFAESTLLFLVTRFDF